MTNPGAVSSLCWEFLTHVFDLCPATCHLDKRLAMPFVSGHAVGCLAGEPYVQP